MRKKSAITTAEMLIALCIMGILAAFALMTIKPYDKSFKFLYVRAYHTLETALYNGMLTEEEFPSNSREFCNLLLSYINSNTHTCGTGDLDRNAAVFPEANIKFVASNGMRFWIASNAGTPYIFNQVIDAGTPIEVKYYIVYVDLNGSRSPNSTVWEPSGKMADIVAFAVTQNSVVIPLGPPEVDTRYMLATAIYPPLDENKPEGTHSNPASYFEAKHYAWGDSTTPEEIMSLNFKSVLPANSPFYLAPEFYPPAPAVSTADGCTAENNKVSPCYVKIEEFY